MQSDEENDNDEDGDSVEDIDDMEEGESDIEDDMGAR